MYITLNGFARYLGIEECKIGQKYTLKKDINNIYDSEAIAVYSDNDVKVAYVANSVNTVAKGTHSAGYVYNLIKNDSKCKILFIVDETAIAELI